MTTLARAQSFSEWRDAARGLLRRKVAPYEVQWQGRGANDDLFGGMLLPLAASARIDAAHESNEAANDAAHCTDTEPDDGSNGGSSDRQNDGAGETPLHVTRDMLAMFETAACYRAEDRWAFLYQVLWRWSSGEHEVLSPADPDGARLHQMIKTVNREAHKMHAFLRFRERPAERGEPRFVAWFEPAHDVLPRVAQHFARRMGKSSWLIATPQGTAMWDGKTLHFGPAVLASPAEFHADAGSGEALWLSYYRSIFNPSRLNTGAMEMHMPVRYWKNLPESRLIPGLISQARSGTQRSGQAPAVGALEGAVIPIQPERAQPRREASTPLEQCRRCELWRHATQAVPGVGPQQARIMIVGEQPGDIEDIAGKPFVGPAGKLLNGALQAAGIERDTVYLTNAVKHFKWEPRGKRRIHKTPAQREVEACGAWLDHELQLVSPTVVLALGSTALRALLGTNKVAMSEVLNQPIAAGDRWIVATWHPSYVLRVPGQAEKDKALEELTAGLRLASQLAERGAPPAEEAEAVAQDDADMEREPQLFA